MDRLTALSKEVETEAKANRVIFWHSDLPPVDAELMGEHTVEATSRRVPGTPAYRDELWNRCYEDLMSQVRIRLEQEVERLGGNYAHVLNEFVDSRHDAVTGEAWLYGRFDYMLYRQSVIDEAARFNN
jgi:hypothetical protein